MNVRNLKDMFQRKQTLEQPPSQGSAIRPKTVTQGHMQPSVSFNYGTKAPVSPPSHVAPQTVPVARETVIQQPRVSVKNNRMFMEELNQKIGRERQSQKNIKNRQSFNGKGAQSNEGKKKEQVEEKKGKEHPSGIPMFPHKQKQTPQKQTHKKSQSTQNANEQRPSEKQPIKMPFQPQKIHIPLPKPTKSQVLPHQVPSIKIPELSSVVVSPPSRPELTMDDIISGVDRKQSFNDNELRPRYGINQRYQNSPREKNLFRDHKEQQTKKIGSFSDLLHTMIDNIKGNKDNVKNEDFKNQTLEKTRQTSRIAYDETYKTEIDKRKRIQFVIKTAFAGLQFQNIGHSQESQNIQSTHQESKKVQQKQEEPLKVEPVVSKPQEQIVLEEIVKNKHEENESTVSSTFKGQVSNQFINQLTMKLFKKSMDSSKIPQEHSAHPPLPPRASSKKKQRAATSNQQTVNLSPRLKKRAKRKQHFDDF